LENGEMRNGSIGFELPDPLISEPVVITQFFSDEMFSRVKEAVNRLNMGPNGSLKYHTMIGRWESSLSFSSDIEDYCLKRARELFNDDTLLKAYFYTVRYQSVDGCIPHLWAHTDQNGTQTSIDITIENTANWGLIVEGKEYEQKENEAVIFAGQQHIHARPPFPSRRNDVYTTVVFLHFTRPDHWIQQSQREIGKYGSDGDIRFFNRKRYLPMPDANVSQPVCKCHDYSGVLSLYDNVLGEYVDDTPELVDMQMLKRTILAPGIVEYEIPRESAEVLKGLSQNACFQLWEPAQVLSDAREPTVNSLARTCYVKFIGSDQLTCHPHDPIRRLYESLEVGIAPIIKDFRDLYSIPLLKSNVWQITRYERDGKFHNHVDDCYEFQRVVSVSMLLNDDYAGGELVFSHHKLSVKPSAGKVVLFSSGFQNMHRVEPVVRGVRYAAVRWYNYKESTANGV
jgi:hypothetical protein